MKYIVITDYTGLEFPVIFPEVVKHDEIALPLQEKGYKILSAGFCLIKPDTDKTISICGKSLSLRIGIRDDDTKLIRQALCEESLCAPN